MLNNLRPGEIVTCSHACIDDRASVGHSAEGITGPTEEIDGSYAGTLRCSKTASMTETAPRLRATLIVVKRTHPESFSRTGAVDTYVDDGGCPGCWRPCTLLTESAPGLLSTMCIGIGRYPG